MKLMVSDIDGTLIDDDRKLPADISLLADCIARCRDRVIFTIASGRIHCRIQEVVDALGITAPVIGCNGASAGSADGFLWNELLPPASVREAMLLADASGMSLVRTDGLTEWAWRKTPWIADLMDNYGRYDGVQPIAPSDWPQARLQKLLIHDTAGSGKLPQVRALLEQHAQSVTVVQYGSDTLDVMPANCSKGAAVLRLAHRLGIAQQDIIAVGDHSNDVEMIKAAGVGAAVANANDELKAAADYLCERPLHHGVLEALEKFSG